MFNWSKRFSKILTAAGIGAFVAVSSLAVPMEASAARTVTNDVMIRNDASTEAGAIGSLEEGEEVTILDAVQSGDGYVWYYIELENGNTGYVRSDLIEASDEELAAVGAGGDTKEEEAPAEEEQEEEAEAPAEESENPESETPAEKPADEAATEAAAAPEKTQDGDYDATKDPDASFSTYYKTDDSGNGEWYVRNDDNGSEWKISDLQNQGTASAKAEGVSGIWRTLAILFGILAVALAAFVLFLLKSIRDGRSKTTRGRALDAAAADRDDDDDDVEDEYYFEDDEASDEEDVPGEEDDGSSDNADTAEEASEEKTANTPDSTIEMDVPPQSDVTEIPTEEIEAAIAVKTAQLEKNISEDDPEPAPAAADAKGMESPFGADDDDDGPFGSTGDNESSETETFGDEVYEEDDSGEAAPYRDDDYEDESDESDPGEDEDYEDEDYEDEDAGEDYEDEDYEDEDYEDEDADYRDEESDEDYEDEDYEDEDYEDSDEDDKSARRKSRSSAKGGFFGFLKKMFGTESSEDTEDEGEDFDDYDDEPEEHEFDEFKEYPEDIDLLPREESDDMDETPEEIPEDFAGESEGTGGNGRGRLSMQRVMKNVSYKEEEADFSDEDDPDDLSDSLFEDDDDMEYSFISSTRKKK